MLSRIRSPAIVLLLVVLGTQLPFLFQAFHIDDRIYLRVAENIHQKPLYPYDYIPLFEGLGAPDAASHSHLPLVSYYLALLCWITGSQAEWVLHLGFLVFPYFGALGFYDLCRRYVRFPLAGACLLIVGPGFLTLSHTLMTDVPFWALWIVALSRFLRIQEGTSVGRDWLIWALALLGVSFISVLGVGLIFLMLACLMFSGRDQCRVPRGKVLLVLSAPLLLWGLWYLRGYFHYDRFLLVNTAVHVLQRGVFTWWGLGERFLAMVLHLGGVIVFPLALWYSLTGRIGLRVLAALCLVSFVPFYLWWENWTWSQSFLFSLFFPSGLMVLWRFLAEFRQKCHSEGRWRWLPIWLWFFGGLLTSLIFYYSGSVRYSTLLAGPVILLWISSLENRGLENYFLRNLVWLGVILTAFYSFAISHADFQLARAYQKAAREITRDYAQQGNTIWFTAEWGLRYYLEQEGAKILARDKVGPMPGDIIIKPYLASPWVTLYDSDKYLDLMEQRPARMTTPLRIMDFSSHAGFYSTGWGILPFSLTGGESWEWFNVFRVKKAFDGPVPEPQTHW